MSQRVRATEQGVVGRHLQTVLLSLSVLLLLVLVGLALAAWWEQS